MNNILPVWRQALKQIKYSWRAILITHLVFSALSLVLFVPLIGLTGRLLLKLSGQIALADQDIAYFLLSPIGLIGLTLFAAILIAILAFEQAAIMRIALLARQGKPGSPLEALLYIAARTHKLLLFTARLVVRILVLALPLLGVAALIAWTLITDYDINYYLTEKPAEFWKAAILIGIVLCVLVVVLGRKLMQWSMALPLLLFAGIAPENAFAVSTRLVHGHRKVLFVVLLSWVALSLLLGFGLLGIIKLVGIWIMPTVYESLRWMVLLLGALVVLWGTSNVLLTAFTSGIFACLLMTLYKQYQPCSRIDPVVSQKSDVEKLSLTLKPKTVGTTMLISTIVAVVAGVWLLNSVPTNNKIIIVAHRGAAGKAPENTLAAFQKAIDEQTDWIELDVQENAEGQIVVMHDSDFMKLAGNPIKIWDATQAQLKDIDIGSWFDPKFATQRVPTLKQVLELARGKAKVVIELKYYGHDQNLEQGVIDIVEGAQMVNETAIMSLKYKAAQRIRGLRPGWTVGLLSATAIGDLSQLDTDFLAVATSMVSAGFITRAHKAGRQVFVWTVNDPVSMSRMISLGVDGLITDEPAMAKRVLAEREKLSTTQRLLIHVTPLFGEPYIPAQYRDNSP